MGRRNIHSDGITTQEVPTLDICLEHADFKGRKIPYVMMCVCLGVCSLIVLTTPVSHFSHEARDDLIIHFSTNEKKEEEKLLALKV